MLAKEVEEVGLIGASPQSEVALVKDVWLFSIKHNLDYSLFSEEIKSFISGVVKVFKQGMYFSYTYDLTNTLQRAAGNTVKGKSLFDLVDETYLWNKKMSEDFSKAKVIDWLVPLIKGYVEIIDEVVNNEPLKLVLISRRGIRRAGTFERTCGVDENGNVANTVESEQILYYKNEVYSFNQLRGSVPVFWTREGSKIDVTRLPEYSIAAFAKHVDHLVALHNRVIMLNLLNEDNESEMKLSRALEANEETYEKNKVSAVRYYHFDIVAETSTVPVT